jgi:hypothetical protein
VQDLLPQHQEKLASSAISDDVAASRGYRSATKAAELRHFDFAPAQRSVPGLIIPLFDIRGEPAGALYRPDDPRWQGGKRLKYEKAAGQANRLDVPPGVLPVLADPSVDLIITEAPIKADSAVSAGLPCVAINGVYGWRGRNAQGGTTALADFDDIALKDRMVSIAFDSDIASNADVHRAAQRFGQFLENRGARVNYARIPPAADGGKQGLDDWLANGGGREAFIGLCFLELPIPPNITAIAQSLPVEAPDLAREQDILGKFTIAVADEGLVGERAIAELLFLAITSRLLDGPVSVGVKGHSSGGKSRTVGAVCKFFPPEAVMERTGMSERALIYEDEDFRHRTIILYEADALREANKEDSTAYYVRSLSEGRLKYDVTVRDNETGGFTTQHIEKEGPTGLIFTTTRPHIHAENETRVLSVTVDDSPAQTKRVLEGIADETERHVDLKQWTSLQAWLQGAEHRVTIPYGPVLARLVPPAAVRLRRDFGAVLALIRAHAILHQMTRQRDRDGRIVATIADYQKVLEIADPLVSQGVGRQVSTTTRDTVAAVEELKPMHPEGVTGLAVANHLDIDPSNAGRRLAVAAAAGYVVNQEDRPRRPGRWIVGEPLPEDEGILPPIAAVLQAMDGATAIAETDKSPGQIASAGSDCAIAVIPGGDNGKAENSVIRVGGHFCEVCGLEFAPIEPGQVAHPLCQEAELEEL